MEGKKPLMLPKKLYLDMERYDGMVLVRHMCQKDIFGYPRYFGIFS